MKKIGVFFICLFVLGCNSNDEPTIENKCNVLSETISSEDLHDIAKQVTDSHDSNYKQ